jgi:hypothetical protein
MSSPSYTSFLLAGSLPAADTVQTHFAAFHLSGQAKSDNALLFDCAYQIRVSVISRYRYFFKKNVRAILFLHYASFGII